MRSTLTSASSNILTFIISLVPIFKSCPPCPVCMPKYAALFALFGLELADYSHYLLPLMLICMLVSLSTMYVQITNTKLSFAPFVLAITASVTLLTSKYIFDVVWLSYFAMTWLIGATIWHHQLNNQRACQLATHLPSKCCN